jgi:hypothetical protein
MYDMNDMPLSLFFDRDLRTCASTQAEDRMSIGEADGRRMSRDAINARRRATYAHGAERVPWNRGLRYGLRDDSDEYRNRLEAEQEDEPEAAPDLAAPDLGGTHFGDAPPWTKGKWGQDSRKQR